MLKPGDSIRVEHATYSVAAQYFYDSPTFRWYEWSAYDAVNARWILVAQIGERLWSAEREAAASAIPPTIADIGPEGAFHLDNDGDVRFESRTAAGSAFSRGRFWYFANDGACIVIVVELGGEATKLTATTLEPTRYEIYPA